MLGYLVAGCSSPPREFQVRSNGSEWRRGGLSCSKREGG